MTMIYGYARVSTDGQTLDAQIAALKAAGAERVFSEKQSGAKTDRAVLAKAVASLDAGDFWSFRLALAHTAAAPTIEKAGARQSRAPALVHVRR
jgi:Resolvase, N terminal domain